MTESENQHLSFDNLPQSVAELHEKIDRLTGMFEQIISSTAVTPLPEIMTVEDVSAMLCKSVSTNRSKPLERNQKIEANN